MSCVVALLLIRLIVTPLNSPSKFAFLKFHVQRLYRYLGSSYLREELAVI